MANGGVLDTSGIMGVIENALNKLNNVAEGASKIEAEIDGANRGTKEWNRTLEETKRHVNEIDSAMDDLNDGGAIETQIKSQKQLQRELNETAKRFLDTQEKLGRFKGFSSDDKLSREITKQFNLIKKGEAQVWEAKSRINKVVNEIVTAPKDSVGAAQFEKISAAITQATDKLSVFLQEIRDVAKEINSKNFGFNFNLTNTQGESERLEQYKNMWRSYGQAVGDALNEVARLSNDREFKTAAGPDFQRQIAQVGMLAYEYDAMEKSFKKSMQSVKTFAGADTAGKQLQEYAARIQPIIEKAKELGRSDFDINRFLKPEIPAGALNQAEKLQTILSGITGQAQEVGAVAANANGGATAQALNNESGAVQKLNEMYELHRAAVAAATAAEVEKTNVSKQLLEALTKEGEALRLNEESNWFSNIEKTVSSIDTAVRSINEFYQSFQQLNSAGDSINQNINEPLKQAGEKLREVDVTILESQLRMVGARMEALRVPSDQMTSSLTAMKKALKNYQNEKLPIKERNEAIVTFNDNNKRANQLIKEQNYLNQQAAKELNELTRAQDELDKSSAKRLTAEQKAAFDDAKRAIEEYYKAQQMLLKDQKAYSDIRLTDNGYQSQSGNYGALAAELNRTKIAYDLVTDAQNKNQLSADGILKLNQQLAEKQRQYELQLEQANNKEREAAEKAAESARKKQEQAEATERAAKAKQIEAMATQQLKDTERQNSANAKEVANDYSRMLDLLRKIGKESANKQNFLASGDLIKAADADKWLKKYIADYRTLKLEIGSKLNTKQLEEITHELQNQKRAIDARNAAAQQAAQGDAVKADQTSLKNATTSYDEIIKSFELLKEKSVEAQMAIDNLKAAMDAVRATNPGTEERAKAMEALAQASTTATAAVDAAAEADRRKAEADALAAKAENEHAEAERKSTKEAQEKERTESKRINMLVQVQKELVRAEAAEKKFSAAQHTTGLKDTYNDLKNTTSQLRDLEQQLRSGVPPTTEMRNQFAQLRSELTRTTADLQLNGNALGRWFTSGVSQLKSRMATTLGLSAMVYKAVGEIKKMVATAVELDSAMNTLQIVTRASGAEMETYGKRVSSMAKETAQATKDLIDATTVYARLGYTMNESATLSKYTAMLQGVGDIEAGAAQDAMTAIIKAFGKNVSEIEDVMDKLVVVGNNFPISVSQLAEGMNNAGSMLAVAGNSFEESVALLTAANTTIQNVSKASTGLRTIAARIRKTNTEEDGGEVIEEAKYQEMVNALTKHHVDLINKETGQYRNTYEVIKDIAAVWRDLTSMEQAAVIEALAGTRQQNIFTSLVTQFQEAEGALERMNNSTGELQESYDIYLDSIQAHVQTLKAAYDELSMDFVNSSLAKGVIDFLTKLVEGLDAVVNHLGVLGTAIAAVGSVGIVKSILSGSFEVGFANIIKLAGAFKSLVMVAPELALFVGTVAGLVVIAKKFNEAYQKAHPTTEQLADDFNKAKNEAGKLEKQISVNTERLEELNEIRANGEWTDKLEQERVGLEEENKKLEEQLTLLSDIAKYKQNAYTGKLNEDIESYFNGGRNVVLAVGLEGELYTDKATEGYGYLWNQLDDYKKALQELEELEERRRKHDWTNDKEAEQLNQDIINKNLDVATYAQRIEDERARLIEWRNSLAEATDEESLQHLGKINIALDKIARETGKGGKSFDDFKSKIKSLSSDALKYLTGEAKNAGKAQQELATWLKKSGYSASEAAEYFIQYAQELKDASDNGKDAVDQTIGSLAGLADEHRRAAKSWEEYQKAMEGGERDDLLKNYQQAWQDAVDDIENSRVDSQKVHAAIDLFIPREVQRALGNDVRKMGEYLSGDFYRSIWESNEDDPRTVAQKAFEFIRDNKSRADGAWVEGNDLYFQNLEKFAEALQLPAGAATVVLKQLDIYGVGVYNSIQDTNALVDSFRKLESDLKSTDAAIEQTVRALAGEGYDRIDIHSIFGDLEDRYVIDIDTDTLHKKIDDIYDTLGETDEEKAEPEVDLNIDSVIENAQNVRDILGALDGYTAHVFVDMVYNPPAGDPTTINENGFSGTSGKFESASATGPSKHSTSTHAGASGKRPGQNGGDTLVNELGPELISDEGRAYIANGGKPGFVRLSDNAIVFTADETKDILRGRQNVNGKALASGNVGRGNLVGRLFRGTVKARAYKVCGNCGATLSATASRCPNCGSFVLITKSDDYGASNAGVNRSALGSPTAVTTGQNKGGNGYYYNPSTQQITYTTYYDGYGYTDTYDSWADYEAYESIARAEAMLVKLEQDALRKQAEIRKQLANKEKANESIFGNGNKNKSLGSSLAGSGGGNHIGGADYSSFADPQKVDWVAVRINRLQRTIADLEKVASSGFKKLDTRLQAARDQIAKTTDEIEVMERAYDRYIQEANSVGLSESIAANVREGTIDIDSYDDDTRKKIDEYTEW